MYGYNLELIDATYYQVDLLSLPAPRFYNLVYAWLYDNLTLVNNGRYMEKWDSDYAPMFSHGPSGTSGDDMDPHRAREELGIKPAEPGKQGDVKIVSKMPKMSWRELQAWKDFSSTDGEMLERLDGLSKPERIPILEEWLEQYRAEGDLAADS